MGYAETARNFENHQTCPWYKYSGATEWDIHQWTSRCLRQFSSLQQLNLLVPPIKWVLKISPPTVDVTENTFRRFKQHLGVGGKLLHVKSSGWDKWLWEVPKGRTLEWTDYDKARLKGRQFGEEDFENHRARKFCSRI
jgi:hypothetical protein